MMTIAEYIRQRPYSTNVKKGGIELLLQGWERRVRMIPFDSAYLFDEWENDLWTRAVIQEILLNCEISEDVMERLEIIDKMYWQKTIPIADAELTVFPFKEEWDKENYWFAYRIPPDRVEDWRVYYEPYENDEYWEDEEE